MELLTAQLAFMPLGKALHPLDRVVSSVSHAYSRTYLVVVYAVGERLTFYVYYRSDAASHIPLELIDPVYAYRFNTRLNMVSARIGDHFPSKLSLPASQRMLLQEHLVASYQQKPDQDLPARSLLKDERSAPSELSLTLLSSPPPMKGHHPLEEDRSGTVATQRNPREPSLSGKRLSVLTETLYLREAVLEHLSLLKLPERTAFRSLWEEFDEWQAVNNDGKNLISTFSQQEESNNLHSLISLRDRLGDLHEQILTERIKPIEPVSVRFLLTEVEQRKTRLRDQSERMDVVATHHLETVENDCASLMNLYRQASAEAQLQFEPTVIEGLHEALRKLNELEHSLLLQEKRYLERQVWIMKER